MKLYFYGLFLQGCSKSTVTLLSPVKNLGFLVRSFPSGCGKILLSPQRVVWLGDTGHSQGTRAQPGASNGCDFLGNPGAIFLPAWDDNCPFEVVPEAGTMHGKPLVPLLVPAWQASNKLWSKKLWSVSKSKYQQILFSCVFQLSVNHLWGRSLSGPFPPLLPSSASSWPRLRQFWSSWRLGRIRSVGRRPCGRPCRWARGDASASRPSSDQGLGSLLGSFF